MLWIHDVVVKYWKENPKHILTKKIEKDDCYVKNLGILDNSDVNDANRNNIKGGWQIINFKAEL